MFPTNERLCRQVRAYEALVAQHKAAAKEAQVQAQHASNVLRGAREAEARSKEREEQATASAAAEAAQVKRLTAERDTLSRQLSRLGDSNDGGRRGSTSGADDQVLETYRRKVKCSLCMINDKDAIINKCMHAFCRECIQKRLDVRNRKCPACAVQFDYQSVKDLFLTN